MKEGGVYIGGSKRLTTVWCSRNQIAAVFIIDCHQSSSSVSSSSFVGSAGNLAVF